MGYLDNILKPSSLKRIAGNMAKMIRKSGVEYDFIAFRGYSGGILAGALSTRLNKPLGFVRKDGEGSHGEPIEVYENDKYSRVGKFSTSATFIIVDDFISTGTTVNKIIKGMEKARCVGIFLWNDSRPDDIFKYVNRRIPIYRKYL